MSAAAFNGSLAAGSSAPGSGAPGVPVPLPDGAPPVVRAVGVAISALTAMCSISDAPAGAGATISHASLTSGGGYVAQSDGSRVWCAPPSALSGDDWGGMLDVRGIDSIAVLLFAGLGETHVVQMGEVATVEWVKGLRCMGLMEEGEAEVVRGMITKARDAAAAVAAEASESTTAASAAASALVSLSYPSGEAQKLCRLYACWLAGVAQYLRTKLAPGLASEEWLFPWRSLKDVGWVFESFGERGRLAGGSSMGAAGMVVDDPWRRMVALVEALQAATQEWAEEMLQGGGVNDGSEARQLLLQCQTHSLFTHRSARTPNFVPPGFSTQAEFQQSAISFVGAVALLEIE